MDYGHPRNTYKEKQLSKFFVLFNKIFIVLKLSTINNSKNFPPSATEEINIVNNARTALFTIYTTVSL